MMARGALPVELQAEAVDVADEGVVHYSAWSNGRLIARLVARADQGWLRLSVADPRATLAERHGLLGAVTDLARVRQLSGVALAEGAQLMLRHAARQEGFTGPLRGDLLFDLGTTDARWVPVSRADPTTAPLHERFLADLHALLPPSVALTVERPAGLLRTLVRTASAGVAGTVHVTARNRPDGASLRVAVPLSDDFMAEGVALTIDTALELRRRFSPLVDGVRIFYDQSVQGLRTGTVAGAADGGVKDIHLNPGYVSVAEMEAQDRLVRDRLADADDGLVPSSHRSPLMVLPPFTRVDEVVAHEFWHQIEFGFESGHYRDSMELRRAVGAYFGVETLEHVIKGAAPDAPAPWRDALARLAQEVSAYATTSPKEATAEMFTQWWCTPADPPPAAQFYDQVLRRFFPAADLSR